MKRSLLLFACSAIVVGFVSCGKTPKLCDADALLSKPQLCPDRDSLGFGLEFCSGTFIGSRPINALTLRNGGMDDLKLSSVTTSGDPAFKYTFSWGSETSTVVKGNKNVFIQVEFAPTAGVAYSGSISVASNAENSPNKTFAVSGCGVPADGGSSTCYSRDSGVISCGRDGG